MSAPHTHDTHAVLGSGPAGRTLAAELVRRGHPVRLVSRSTNGPEVPGAERRAADLTTSEGARAAVEGAAVVYHCANVPYADQVEVMPRMQRALLDAVAQTGARLVVLDTLYPYGSTGGAVLTEDTPWNAVSDKGRMRADLDREYLAAHREGRARVAMGRAADFIGPEVLNSATGGAVFPAALAGEDVVALGDADLPHSRTDIRDVARGLAVLGERPEGDGRVWHLPTAPAVSAHELHRMIEERVGRPVRTVEMRELRPFGPFDADFVAEFAELFYQYTEAQVMDSGAFQEAFGVRPTPLGETLDATIAWYRSWLAAA